MAYGPMNARSELVMPPNFSGGGVLESTCKFQVASAAFMSPARRPTRGSGLGATVDMFAPPDEAHAARAHNPIVRARDRTFREIIGESFEETEADTRARNPAVSLTGPLEEQRGEHLLHASDFGGLIGIHVGGEPEDLLLLSRALTEELVHHGDRAFVMLDHECQEQPVELRPPRAVELRQLLRSQHPGHHRRRIHAGHHSMRGAQVGVGFVPVAEPPLHENDLVALAYHDPLT